MMNCAFRKFNVAATSLIEVVVVVAIIAIAAGMLLPAVAKAKAKVQKSKCTNNLKNIGLAFRIFANHHEDKFPMRISTNYGGTLEYSDPKRGESHGVCWKHFHALSNELNTPKIILCPEDNLKGIEATNFNIGIKYLRNKSVSYFVGLQAEDTRPQMLLSGDRNLTNTVGAAKPHSTIDLSIVTTFGTNSNAGWDNNMHKNQGNICLSEGSVQTFSSIRIREQFKNSGDENNRIVFPGKQ